MITVLRENLILALQEKFQAVAEYRGIVQGHTASLSHHSRYRSPKPFYKDPTNEGSREELKQSLVGRGLRASDASYLENNQKCVFHAGCKSSDPLGPLDPHDLSADISSSEEQAGGDVAEELCEGTQRIPPLRFQCFGNVYIFLLIHARGKLRRASASEGELKQHFQRGQIAPSLQVHSMLHKT